jgi:lysophospholipase L1-like esterase
MLAVPAMAWTRTKQIDYVAFGDSCAAGVLADPVHPGSTLFSDFGYTDDINNMIRAIGIQGNFSEFFCTSGQTSYGLLQQIADNQSTFKSLVGAAEIVTIDIGANDLLGPLYAYYEECVANEVELTIEGATPALNEIINGLSTTSKNVQANIQQILRSILNVNKNVKIYVMGYYNPLPALEEQYNIDLSAYVVYFNSYIARAVANVVIRNFGASITYVPTLVPMKTIHPEENLLFPR